MQVVSEQRNTRCKEPCIPENHDVLGSNLGIATSVLYHFAGETTCNDAYIGSERSGGDRCRRRVLNERVELWQLKRRFHSQCLGVNTTVSTLLLKALVESSLTLVLTVTPGQQRETSGNVR